MCYCARPKVVTVDVIKKGAPIFFLCESTANVFNDFELLKVGDEEKLILPLKP